MAAAPSSSPRVAARPYQLELFEAARRDNIVAFLDTGSGKTLVSILLIQHTAESLLPPLGPAEEAPGAPSTAIDHAVACMHGSSSSSEPVAAPSTAPTQSEPKTTESEPETIEIYNGIDSPKPQKIVFLAPTVPLVAQQAAKIRADTFLRVGEYSGDDSAASLLAWGPGRWRSEMNRQHVLVLTPQVFLNLLRHGFVNLSADIALLVLDECHHAGKMHPYCQIMLEHYHTITPGHARPRIFGMTASPIRGRATTEDGSILRLDELQSTLDCRVVTIADRSQLEGFTPRATEILVEFDAPSSSSKGIERILIPQEQDTPAVLYLRHYLNLLISHAKRLGACILTEAYEKRNSSQRSRLPSKQQQSSSNVAPGARDNDIEQGTDDDDEDDDNHVEVQGTEVQKTGSDQGNDNKAARELIESLMANLVTVFEHLGVWYTGIVSHEYYEAYIAGQSAVLEGPTSASVANPNKKRAVESSDAYPNKRDNSRNNSCTPQHDASEPVAHHLEKTVPQKPKLPEIQDSDLSSKSHALIRILRSHCESSTDGTVQPSHLMPRAMVFVASRWMAGIISDMINTLAPSLFPAVRCGFATGHGRQSTGMSTQQTKHGQNAARVSRYAPARMNATYQRQIFERFRKGEFNILVVTSVAEEGIDVPSCRLVVAFDLFRTQTAYVQSRGRARDVSGATYVVMVPKQDKRFMRAVAQARMAELITRRLVPTTNHALADQSSSKQSKNNVGFDGGSFGLPTGARLVQAGATDNMVTDLLLGSRETPLKTRVGASLRSTSASSLIHLYLARIRPRSSGSRIDPAYKLIKSPDTTMLETFSWTQYIDHMRTCRVNQTKPTRSAESNNVDHELDAIVSLFPTEPPFGYIYSISLPPSASIPLGKVVYGLPRWTPRLAMHHAAFETCKLLWQLGDLDDYLLPKVPKKPLQHPITLPDVVIAKSLHMGAKGLSSAHCSDASNMLDVDKDGDAVEDVVDQIAETSVALLEIPPQLPQAFAPTSPAVSHAPAEAAPTPLTKSEHTRFITVIDFEDNTFDTCRMHDIVANFANRSSHTNHEFKCPRTTYALCTPGPIPCKRIPRMSLWSVAHITNMSMSMSPWPKPDFNDNDGHVYKATTFSADHVAAIMSFQTRLWDMTLRRPKTIHAQDDSGVFQSDSNGRLYEVLPMIWCEADNGWQIYWSLIESINSERAVNLYNWVTVSAIALQDKKDDDSESTGNPVWQIDMSPSASESCHHRFFLALSGASSQAAKPALPSCNLDTVIKSPEAVACLDTLLSDVGIVTRHNYAKYWRVALHPDMNANATFPLKRHGQPALKISYAEYGKNNGYVIEHPDMCLFSVKNIPGIRNALGRAPLTGIHDTSSDKPVDPDADDTNQHTDKRSNRKSRNRSGKDGDPNNNIICLVSEACNVLPIPVSFIDKIYCLPSILYRLDSYCLADEIDQRLAVTDTCCYAKVIPLSTLRSALVCPGAEEDTNYERLETLGDAFLKFGSTLSLFLRDFIADEGVLSRRRSSIVCNKNLFRVAMRQKLAGMLNIAPFKHRLWTPPGPHRVTGNTLNKDGQLHKRLVSIKMLADFVEAIIGAYYIECGQEAGLVVLDRLGIVSKPRMTKLPSLPHVVDIGCARVNAAGDYVESESDVLAVTDTIVQHIQQHLSYIFSNRRLAIEAMTHPSLHSTSRMQYERLEFLGDAILDIMITRHMYISHPIASPATLCDMRQVAASNESFCRLAVSLGIHNMLRHAHPTLHNDMTTYAATIDSAKSSQKHLPSVLESTREGPKALGDAFEALVGAVFLDCGGNLHTTWTVFSPVIVPFLNQYATPDVVARSPVREFNEMLQSRNVLPHEISFVFEMGIDTDQRGDHDQNVSVSEPIRCCVSVLGFVVSQRQSVSKNMAKRLSAIDGIEWLMQLDDSILDLMKKRARIIVKPVALDVSTNASKSLVSV